MADDFETKWKQISQQILAYCRRSVGDASIAEDIFQQVAIRALRGYSTFRGEATFLTWAFTITRREIIRYQQHRYQQSKSEMPLEQVMEDSPGKLPYISAPEIEEGIWSKAVKAASTAKILDEIEAAVIFSRAHQTDGGWEEIGAMLGISGNNCAVTHLRAILKLRVFLFSHRPDILGGKEIISEALTQAMKNQDDPMVNEEIDVFQELVLKGQTNYRRANVRQILRSACSKVIRYIPMN